MTISFGKKAPRDLPSCGVIERVKRITAIWFGYVEKMEHRRFTKRVYMNEVVGSAVRGRPLVKWEIRVGEYMKGRGGFDKPGSTGMENWRTFYCSLPLGG